MDINTFVQKFAEQFDETVNISSDTVFHELDEYSSLIALSIIAMVDEEYDVQLKGDDMRSAITVADLFDIVNSRI